MKALTRKYAVVTVEEMKALQSENLRKVTTMRAEYDFSKAVKNPYAAQLKKQITIRLDEESLSYFKSISADVGIPYQSLINLYLRDCATSHRKLDLKWK
jgi:predicted DNA binding CopG/RHH family protein